MPFVGFVYYDSSSEDESCCCGAGGCPEFHPELAIVPIRAQNDPQDAIVAVDVEDIEHTIYDNDVDQSFVADAGMTDNLALVVASQDPAAMQLEGLNVSRIADTDNVTDLEVVSSALVPAPNTREVTMEIVRTDKPQRFLIEADFSLVSRRRCRRKIKASIDLPARRERVPRLSYDGIRVLNDPLPPDYWASSEQAEIVDRNQRLFVSREMKEAVFYQNIEVISPVNLINVLFKGENRRGFALMLGDAETVDGQPRQYWLWPSSELRFACYYSADQIPDNQLGYPTGLTDPRNVLLDWWDDNANIKTDSTVELLDVTAHPQDQDFGYQVYVQDETEKGILPWFQSSFPYHLHPQFNLTFTCESFNLPRTSDFKKGWYYVMVDWNVEQQSSFGCFAMNLSNDVLPQPEIKFRYGSDTFPGHNTAEISAGVGKVIYIHVDNTQPVQEYYFYDTSVGTDDRLYTLTGIGENSVDIGVGSLVEPTLILRPSKIWQNQRYTIEMTAFNGVDVLGSKFYTVEFVDVTPDLVNSTQFTGSLAMGRTSTGTDPSWQRRERVVTEEINGNDVGWFAGASVNGLLYPTVVVPLCKVKTKTDYIVTLKKSFLGTVYEVMYDYTMRCNIGPSTSSYIWPSANGQVYGGDALNSLITIPLSFKNHYQGLVMIEIVIKFDLNTNPIAFPRYQEVVSWLPALSVPLVNQMVKTRQVEGPQRADSTIFLTANDGNTYSINVTDRGYHLSEDERLRYYGPTFITFFGSFLIVGSSLTASLANVSGMNGGTGLSEYFEILPSHVTEGTYFGNTGRFVRFRAKSGSQGQIFRIKCCSKIKASLP